MGTRIGDLLVHRGLVELQELEEALERQVLVGARLGTNLVESGAIGIDALADVLAEQRGLPAAPKQHFERPDASVQARLSPRLASAWAAVPLGKTEQDGRVAVAVLDPLPPEAVRELGEILGGEILQAIAPELRVRYELERAFGLRRPNRFLRVPPRVRDPSSPGVERRRYVRTLSTELDIPQADAQPLGRVAVQRVAVPRRAAEDQPHAIETFHDALRAIRRATGRERVAEVALEAIQRAFTDHVSAAAVFVIRDNVGFGWKGYSRRADAVIEDVAVPLAEASVLSSPLHRGPYAGPAPAEPSPIDAQLWSLLGERPASLAVAPVDVGGRTACLLYAQSDASGTFTAVAGHRLSELAQAMSSAFDFLIRAAER